MFDLSVYFLCVAIQIQILPMFYSELNDVSKVRILYSKYQRAATSLFIM